MVAGVLFVGAEGSCVGRLDIMVYLPFVGILLNVVVVC